ncbi:MAG: SDR family oxidoreductase [Pseudomonadota bacterium]
MKRVLVLGGSGMLGQALLRELAQHGASAAFTYCSQAGTAGALSGELGFPAYAADLRQRDAVATLFDALERDQMLPEVVVHCAGIAPAIALEAIDCEAWDEVHAIHGRAALQCAQQMAQRGLRGSLLLVAALDGIEAVPAPAHYAASQAAMWGLTMALAKELGPKGILVNLAAVGVLDGGISAHLTPALREQYRRYAALGRAGTCAEAARALRWMALENTYMNGSRISLTGGLG